MIKTRLLLIFIGSFLLLDVFAQESREGKQGQDFKNQGEQEQYWGLRIFETEYKPETYEKYKGKISVAGNTFKYDSTVLFAYSEILACQAIFTSGILYPGIFNGDKSGEISKSQNIPDPSGVNKNPLYFFIRLDSMGVSILDELRSPNNSPTVKRFKLYLSRQGFMNPSMYVFEITNTQATNTTNLIDFIKGARLTFLKFVSLLI